MSTFADTAGSFLTSVPFPALLILKSIFVLIAGALVAFLLRAASASVRYVVWALTIAMIVALPLGMLTAPAWRVAVGQPSTPESIAPVSTIATEIAPAMPAEPVAVTNTYSDAPVTTSVAPQKTFEFPEISPFIIWLIGTMLVIARMIVGRISLARLAKRSGSLTGADWTSMVHRESARLGIERDVRLFQSDRVSTPLAAGFGAPFIIVPDGAEKWSVEHREVVLRHELAHIARGDAVVCLLSGIACAIYWFNPLVWLASRKLRAEQERACDDRVITLGTPAADYAAHLLEVAKSARVMGMHSFVSVAMARPSQLEGRLLAVLGKRRRAAITRSGSAFAATAAFAALMVVSAFIPVKAESKIVVASLTEYPAVLVTAPLPESAPEENPEESSPDSSVWGDVVVQSGGTLTLDLRTGAGVDIRGTDEEHVRVQGTLGGRDWRDTDFAIFGDSTNARIRLAFKNPERSQSSSHRLTITVPRRFNVRIESSGGDIVLRDVEGTFTGHTGGGQIRIDDVTGRASLTTGGGSIEVRDSHLSGSVTTGGGAVVIDNVTGGLNGSSGSGGVTYGSVSAAGAGKSSSRGVTINNVIPGAVGSGKIRTASGDDYYVRKSGGDIRIAEAPNGASVGTGGGHVTIGRSNGDVSATTGGGDMTVGPVNGAVELTTGAGDVRVTVTSTNKPINIASGNGTITLILPEGMSANLDLETAFTRHHRGETRIQSDWPVSTTVTSNWDNAMGTPRRYVRTRSAIGGGGPTIRVRTVNGNIIIRRR